MTIEVRPAAAEDMDDVHALLQLFAKEERELPPREQVQCHAEFDRLPVWRQRAAIEELCQGAEENILSADKLSADFQSTPRPFECLIARREERTIAFVIYYCGYNPGVGRVLRVESIFVEQQSRRSGAALRLFFDELAEVAARNGSQLMEGSVIKANVDGLLFYGRLGALLQSDLLTFRLRLSRAI